MPIDLVTVSQPSVRHKCRVHSITPDAVVCGVGIARKPVTYRRDDVAALILPPTHAAHITAVIDLAVGAACLAGSFFVPITAVAVILQIVAGISPFVAISNVFDDDDHSDDKLAYQRPNTPLTVTLRTH